MQQQINHVSHVCFIYTRDNLPIVMQQFGKAFNITDWDGPVEVPYFGILQAQSVSTGIELLAPMRDDDNVFAEHIRTKGEGFFAMTFGVADVRSEGERARKLGIEVYEDDNGVPAIIDGMRIKDGAPPHPSWPSKLRRYDEIALKPLCGVNLYLGQIEPL